MVDTMNEDALLRATASGIAADCRPGKHDGCWKALSDTGFARLREPDEHGSPVGDAAQTTLVVEQLATVVCGAPLVGSLLAGELLRLAGASASEPHTVVLTDDLAALGPASGTVWDATAMSRALALDGDELISVGLGEVVPSAELARGMAATGEHPESLGARLDGESLRRFENFARLMLSADLLGAADGLFRQANEYARQRMQFGRSIGSFQAVQHLLARAYTEVEAMRSTLAHAADAVDTDSEAREATLVAKAYTSEAAVSVVETAIQVFGGVAITWEFPAHLHLRRVLSDAEAFGSADRLYELLYDEVEGAGR